MKFLIAFLLLPSLTFAQEALLIGTFHFNNPGADAVKLKSINILTAPVQQELEQIAEKIKAFNPDKIYVEWDFRDQSGLDTLYHLYITDQYQHYSKNKNSFYQQNEIFQLAFRAGKKCGLKRINAIDVNMDWPSDTAFAAMKSAGQDSLINEISEMTKALSAVYNHKMQTLSLTQIILDLNTPADRKQNIGFYLKTFNKAGKKDDFSGAYSVAEWYRRNLYMYAQVQKQSTASDKRIMILLGAGHTAMFKQFIDGGRPV
jgi:hypothetical protein